MGDWEPLINFFEDIYRVATFMFIYRCHQGQAEIFAYKHLDTRRYLFLDSEGNCYRFVDGGNYKYEPITLREALQHVYQGWP